MGTLLGNILSFPKPEEKKDSWKDMAKDALCDTKDSHGVMKALKEYDDRSVWFVLVSSGKKGDTLKRPKRHSDKGKGWAANYKGGKLYDTDKCGHTMVIWRGKDLKMGDPGKCDTKKTSDVMQEVISRGKHKKDDNKDVMKRLKKKSKKEGLKHFFFIIWSSGSWKWTSYGMSVEENECLVQNPNGFFLINSGEDDDSSSSSEEDSDEDSSSSSSSSEEDSDEDSSSSSEEDSDEESSKSSEEDSDEESSKGSEEDSDEDSDEDSSKSSKEDSDEDSSKSSEEDSDEDSSRGKKEDSSESSEEDNESEEGSESKEYSEDSDEDPIFGGLKSDEYFEDLDEDPIVEIDSDSNDDILQLRQSAPPLPL